jgi:hypothetical protein
MSPFDYVDLILHKKKQDDDFDIGNYAPFLVNRSLSYHMDCILHVNEMNIKPNVDKDLQYQYLLNSIRPMKRRFEPWQKSSVDKDIQCVKEFFGYNNQKAKDALSILTDEQIAEIKIRIDKGGVNKS